MEPGEWPGILISTVKVNEEPVIRAVCGSIGGGRGRVSACGREIGPLNCSRERQAGDCSQAGPVLCSNDISASSVVLSLFLACIEVVQVPVTHLSPAIKTRHRLSWPGESCRRDDNLTEPCRIHSLVIRISPLIRTDCRHHWRLAIAQGEAAVAWRLMSVCLAG